jgi:DNA topoisomerase-1
VCRKYYVHPKVLDAFLDGSLFEAMSNPGLDPIGNSFGLSAEEVAVLKLLE